MLYCYCCNTTFETPKMVPESRGEFWGIPCWEDMAYCPNCDGDEIEEIPVGEEDKYQSIAYICHSKGMDFDEALEYYEENCDNVEA